MFNLLKSDMYRVVRMPSFWVISLVVVLAFSSIAAFMNYLASPEFAQSINDSIAEKEFDGLSDEEMLEIQEGIDDAPEVLNDKTSASITYLWANAFMDGGMLGVIGSLLVVIFLLSDIKNGFIKNIPMDRCSRKRYYLERIILVFLMQAYVLALCALTTSVAFGVCGFTYETTDTAGGIALWLFLAWLYASAMALIVACITWLARSEALSSIVSIFISGGILGAISVQVCFYFSNAIPLLASIPQWLLTSSLIDLRNGATGLFESSAYELFSFVPQWGHSMVIDAIFIIVACVIIMSACRKKDVA